MASGRRPTKTATKQARAVIYVRVSTEDQAGTDTDDGYSLPVQIRECERKADDLGALVVEVYKEPGKSARSTKRPALQAMLQRIEEQQDVDVVIVHRVNRFARNTRDALNIESRLATAGVHLMSATESWDLTPMGKFFKLIHFGQAEMFSEQLSEEVRSKMEEKMQRGGTSGPAPPGYLNVRKTVGGVPNVADIEIDPEQAEHIVWAFETFARGDHTVEKLRQELTERGFTLRATRRYPERPIQRSTLNRLLKNPYYIGIVTWGGKQYAGKHEPLIDTATFERVQAVLGGNNTGGDKSWRYVHYLKGTLYCGADGCGERLGLMHGRGNGGEYLYFYCQGRQKKSGCTQSYIPAHLAEEAVERCYQTLKDEAAKRLPLITAGLTELLSRYDDEIEHERDRLRRSIDRLRREQKKLLQLSYDDALPDELVKDEQRRITGDLRKAEEALIATDVDQDSLQTNWRELEALAADPETAYLRAPDDLRRAHNQFWFEKIYLTSEGATRRLDSDVAEFVLRSRLRNVQHREDPDIDWDEVLKRLRNEEPPEVSDGSNVAYLVPRTGFEPVLPP